MRRPLLLSALASVAFATAPLAQVPSAPPAAAQSYVAPNSPTTTIQAELNRSHGLTQWRPVATRIGFGAAFTPATSLIYQTQFTSRIAYQAAASVSAIKLRYCNAYDGVGTYAVAGGSGGEIVNANPITVTGGVFTNTDRTKASWAYNDGGNTFAGNVSFNGANSVAISGGYCVDSDPIYVNLSAGQSIYINSSCAESVAKTCPSPSYTSPYAATSYDGNNVGFAVNTVTCNGGTSYSWTSAAPLPLITGSVRVLVPGQTVIMTDNGSGAMNAGNGLASGTVNYATGAVAVVFSSSCTNGTVFFPNATGGSTPVDATKTTTMTNFSTSGTANPTFGPVAVLGLPATTAPLRAFGFLGDSIDNGSGNANSSVSWLDYSNPGYGVVKGAISGELLATFANPLGRQARMRYFGDQIIDRIVTNWGTNDIYYGRSLSQLITDFHSVQPALASLTPNLSGSDVWWVSAAPRTNSSNVAAIPAGGGPYTAAGAAYGSGAVANPTPLGGGFGSGVLGNGILTATITGDGTTGPFAASFGGATLIGSLWSDNGYTTVVDTGAGGTGATTLSGSRISTGTHTPSTGAVSLTFAAVVPIGQTVKLYAFASGPSARNAWNYFLYNYATPKGLVAGVIDLASCVETSPASASGAGSGQWISSSYTSDWTHPSPSAHQTTIPACVASSPFWTLQ